MFKSNTNEFSKFLVKKMAAKNISVNELSEKLNLSKFYIYKWLKSERIPSSKKNHLEIISNALHLSATETQELREVFYISIIGLHGQSNINIVSHILRKPLEIYHDLFRPIENPSNPSTGYTLIKGYFIMDALDKIIGDVNAFSDGDTLFVSCNEILDTEYYKSVVTHFKILLEKGVNITHIISLSENDLFNILALERLLPLILLKAKGSYKLGYLNYYEDNKYSDIICSPYKAGLFLDKGTLIFDDKPTIDLFRYEFEDTIIPNALAFYEEYSETYINNEDLSEIINFGADIYTTLGLSNYELNNKIHNNKKMKKTTKHYNILFENEIENAIRNNISINGKKFDNPGEFKSYINNTSDKETLVINEKYFSLNMPVYVILNKSHSVILYICLDKKYTKIGYRDKLIIQLTESTIVQAFEHFFHSILFKYNNIEIE